ncbi:MAG: radical SAM protein [Candidatus Pacearchaeota archaeon]|jgi:anaerobic magnesium-protoporphyrin IX monomethyl ester cyclase
MRVNIVDPGSARAIVDKESDEGSVMDVIGLSSRVHEPIGACYVARDTMDRGNEVNVIFPKSANLSVEEVLRDNPQVVAFSSLTYNYPLALEVAKRTKDRNSGIITVIGGYHATCVPKEISTEPAFDYIVSREADHTLGDLVEFSEGKRKQEEIRGLVYMDGQVFVDNFQRLDPNENPIPLRTKDMVKGMKRQGLYYPAPSDQRSIILLVGSRGCDYACKFCLSSEMFPSDNCGNRTRFRNIDNILQEITECQLMFGTNYGFFVDLNFYGGDKGRIEKLCGEIAKTGFKWYAMSRVDVDPEILFNMGLGGCTEVGFGVESLTKPLKSGFNGTMSEWQAMVKERVRLLKNMGVLSKGYFILGDQGDSKQSLEEEREAILDSDFDELRLSFMMYSPGTPIFERLKREGRFLTDDLSKFSTDYPVIKVDGMTPEDMNRFRIRVYRDYYSSRKYADQVRDMICRFPHLRKSYAEFNQLLVNSLGQGFSD